MSTAKSPVSTPTPTGQQASQQPSTGFAYVNFNDNTALHILQVLSDLYCEQEGYEPVKLSLKKEA